MGQDELEQERRLRLAAELVAVLPSFGRWISSIRNADTPFGRMAYRQVEILYIIRKNLLGTEIATPSQLAEFMSVRRSVVTRVLANLEERGFIERHVSPEDGRSQALSVTASGVEVSVYIEDIFLQEMLESIAFLDEERAARLSASLQDLRQLSANLEACRKRRDPLGTAPSDEV